VEVPEDLKGLALYEEDQALCALWHSLMAAWGRAFPRGREWILGEVTKAHAWEVANPERRKKRRGHFLTNWMTRAQDRGVGGGGGRKPWTDAWDELKQMKDTTTHDQE